MRGILALLLVACTTQAPPHNNRAHEAVLPAPTSLYPEPPPSQTGCASLLGGQPCCSDVCAEDITQLELDGCLPPSGKCFFLFCESAVSPIVWGAKVCNL